MAGSEAIQTVVMQVAIQATVAAVMVMRDADAGPTPGSNMVNLGETWRHGGLALK